MFVCLGSCSSGIGRRMIRIPMLGPVRSWCQCALCFIIFTKGCIIFEVQTIHVVVDGGGRWVDGVIRLGCTTITTITSATSTATAISGSWRMILIRR
jgi:hypothetical protein